MTLSFGKPCSPGIALGKACLFQRKNIVITQERKNPEHELPIFRDTLAKVNFNLNELLSKHKKLNNSESAEVLEAHLMMLEDPEWISGIEENIKSGTNAANAVHEVSQMFIKSLEALDDPYLRQRANDIKDVSDRVIATLQGVEISQSLLNEPAILIAEDLLPSELLSLNLENLLGVVLEKGNSTSHTAILAKTLEIPLLINVSNISSAGIDGKSVGLDATAGSVVIDPSPSEKDEIIRRQAIEKTERKNLNKFVNLETITTDGHSVELACNLNSILDLDLAKKKGTEGVGLFRTEFLLFDRPNVPSEDEQYLIYKKALSELSPHRTVIRTFDIGGDKQVAFLNLKPEANPFLGLRGLRLCLKMPELFIPQLRALLRASVHGKLAIMAPMVTNVDEVKAFKQLIEETKATLQKEGHSISENIEIGIMIEIPAVAMIADQLSEHLDFFSVGTNDLIQYLCAADRMNDSVNELHDMYHPAVLRTLKLISDLTKDKDVWIGLCGELAAQKEYVPLLLAMNFKELSVSPGAFLTTRKAIRSSSLERSTELLTTALKCNSSKNLKQLLEEFNPTTEKNHH